jgi:hypothetical protein
MFIDGSMSCRLSASNGFHRVAQLKTNPHLIGLNCTETGFQRIRIREALFLKLVHTLYTESALGRS